MTAAVTLERSRLRRRLAPLQLAAFLQGVGFWVPIEKLFMTEIGFTAATIGLMAGAYALVTPLIELPSGILADRWSRRGVLVIAGVALALSSLIGGLSHNVPTYIGSAVALGVYFAMSSGTMDSIVYDTLLEETGGSDTFEQQIGRLRLVSSAALVASALVGGVLASLISNRATYFITVPFVAASIVPLLRLDEPRLHKAQQAGSVRQQLKLTLQAITQRRRVLPIVTLAVLASLITQTLVEFGPLWLVALSAPAVLFGPYWAGLTSMFGLGGLLAGRLPLDRAVALAPVVLLLIGSAIALTVRANSAVVIGAQLVMMLLVMVAGIHVTRALHDAVPSAIRSGVASGVSALSWLVFLPMALGFGALSQQTSVFTAGWLLVGTAVLASAMMVQQFWRAVPEKLAVQAAAALAEPSPLAPGTAMDCSEFVELVTGFIQGTLDRPVHERYVDHLLTCPGCERYLDQFRVTIDTLGFLPTEQVSDDARAALDTVFAMTPTQAEEAAQGGGLNDDRT